MNKEQSAINSDISDSAGSQQHEEDQGKEVVTAPGPSTLPPPPPPDSGNEVGNGAATAPLTVEDLKQLWKEATAKEKEEKKKRLKEKSDLKQKRLREARAELKEAIQAARKKPKVEPKEHEALDSNEDASSSSDDEGEHTGKSVRKRLTQVEKWANGHKGMGERQQVYITQATVDTWPEAYGKMRHGGFAIMNNFTSLLGRSHRPDMEQRDYIRHAAEADKQVVFEAVYLDDQSTSVTSHYDKDHVDARRQLKDNTKKFYMDYKAKYAPQQADIIAGICLKAGGRLRVLTGSLTGTPS